MEFEIRLEEPANIREGVNREPWSEPGFLKSVALTHNLKAWLLTCHKGEELVATLPLYERSRMGIKYLVEPVTAYYQPLEFFNASGHEPSRLLRELSIMEAIAGYLKKSYRRLRIKLYPANSDVRGFLWSGMNARPYYTFVHRRGDTLDPIRNEKRKLKSAWEIPYQFDGQFNLEAFLALYHQMHKRKERKLSLPQDKMESFCRALHEQGILHQHNVSLENEIVSSEIYLGKGEGTAYALYRASKPEEMAKGVSSWHTARALDELLKVYEKVDMCGANIADVARFKAALGLKLAVFYQIEYGSKII